MFILVARDGLRGTRDDFLFADERRVRVGGAGEDKRGTCERASHLKKFKKLFNPHGSSESKCFKSSKHDRRSSAAGGGQGRKKTVNN